METREPFLRAYRTQVLDALVLPPFLRAQYTPEACLKDGARQVYLVRDRAGWPAVLKLQPAGREDALRQEYDLLRELRHPQLPRPLAYLEWEGTEYLVREYVEGVSLSELTDAHGPLPPARVRAVALSLCQVLQALHSHRPPVICRDIKPQNVVLDPEGRCHLIDLGAARRYRPDQREDTVCLGAQLTAPPEQFGYQQTDQRSDLYSLGMLMRFLLSGRFDPLPAGTRAGGLRRVIRRCTAFDPKNRYPSVPALCRALQRPRPRRLAGACAAALCLALLLSLLWRPAAQTLSHAPLLWRPAAQAQVSSSLLEAALRQELGLEEGEAIPAQRLGEVEQLLVCGQTLVDTLLIHEQMVPSVHDRYQSEVPRGDVTDADLALLAQCGNLRVLVLDYQQIADLSPLAGLPLEYLSLTGNQVSDLTPLADCRALQVLDLCGNPVRSIDTLAQLPALREVVLEATGITSVELFAGSGLQSLNVYDTWVSDLSPLETCPELTRLVVGALPGGAVETLEGLRTLRKLQMYSTNGVDLNCLLPLQALEELDLFACSISHPEALAGLPALRYANLGETGLSDLSFLPQMPALVELELREDPISDLTPLLDCPWLTRLVLSPNLQPLAQKQLSQASFSIQYQ